MKPIEEAKRRFEEIVGRDSVITDTSREEKATFPTSQKIPLVVKPSSTQQVSDCVKVANDLELPVYPVSRGKNWGLGSKVPVTTGQILLDLSGMNLIAEVDEEMGYAIVEPGVSFKDLYDHLTENDSGLMLDGIGGAPESSIVGNTVERGEGLGPFADRFNHVCAMEVVLPTGEIINTGFKRFPNSQLGNLSKWGVGPWIDGLFTQSNLGIVTRLTIFLRKKPIWFQSVMFHVDSEEKLGGLVDTIRDIRLAGFQFALRIINDFRLASFVEQYPWRDADGKTPLPDDLRLEMRKRNGNAGAWIGSGALYSVSKEHGLAEKAFLESKLKPWVERLQVYDENRAAREFTAATERQKHWLNILFYESSMRGHIGSSAVRCCYWRKRILPYDDIDVHRDKCGILWYCPQIPARANCVEESVAAIEKISAKWQFEPNVGLHFISDRAIDVTGAIFYDREIPGEDDRAMQCYAELLEFFETKGFTIFRHSIHTMNTLFSMEPSSSTMLHQIKRVLDPKQILAPGRYQSKKTQLPEEE